MKSFIFIAFTSMLFAGGDIPTPPEVPTVPVPVEPCDPCKCAVLELPKSMYMANGMYSVPYRVPVPAMQDEI